MQRLYKLEARRGRKRARITRADAEAIQIKGPQREEKAEPEESGCWSLNKSRARRRRRKAGIKRAAA